MAKYTQPVKVTKSEYPSPYGSHTEMLNKELTDQLVKDTKMVVCKDERGNYLTEKSRLDNKLADTYRYASDNFRQKMLKETTA